MFFEIIFLLIHYRHCFTERFKAAWVQMQHKFPAIFQTLRMVFQKKLFDLLHLKLILHNLSTKFYCIFWIVSHHVFFVVNRSSWAAAIIFPSFNILMRHCRGKMLRYLKLISSEFFFYTICH